MVLDEHAGSVHGVHALEALDDDVACLELIVAHHLSFGHVGGAGDGVVEVVCVGGADVGEVDAGLCPCGGVGGVGVDHAADFRECAVEREVGGGVGRGAEFAFNHVAVEVDDHHVLSLHVVIVDTAGFDDHEAGFGVYAGDVAPGVDDEAMFHKVYVGLEYFFF